MTIGAFDLLINGSGKDRSVALIDVARVLSAWRAGELSDRAALVTIEQTLAEQKGRE